MNKFKKPYGGRASTSRPEGRPRFSASARPRPSGGRKDIPQKFDAVCSKCGNACQVPFRPSNTRPVYCKDCFGAPQQTLPSKKILQTNGGEGKSIADLTRQIAAMNTKIDSMLKILEDGNA